MLEKIQTFGKFLDQPMLISKLNKHMPKIVTLGAAAYIGKDVFEKRKEHKLTKQDKKDLLNKGMVMTLAILSAFMAPKIASKITGRKTLESIDVVQNKTTKLINDFIKNNNPDKNIISILNKAKEKPLTLKEVSVLIKELNSNKTGQEFIKKLIPDPDNIKAKDIFSEIGYLSIYGAVPVMGGIAGGIVADRIEDKKTYKDKIPDKINEGLYQYLANIFMCNVGAGAALAILEKAGITSKAARALGMTAGIILTGVVGGAKIANTISQKIINPFLSPNKKLKERKPEPMDLCMHTDDIATVSLLSGLKWIEPSLPILYTVSGYKAGVGYRNA